jgi:hypothetical protein
MGGTLAASWLEVEVVALAATEVLHSTLVAAAAAAPEVMADRLSAFAGAGAGGRCFQARILSAQMTNVFPVPAVISAAETAPGIKVMAMEHQARVPAEEAVVVSLSTTD